ncbi:MAG: tryptophan--tRNA ligase [Chloracidobacterium sp.]|nr:tryptophan--tRNA ligase [Chloracidobacterium sp.]
MKKRIFSGAQPTGELHIGNYLGALKNWVALQDEYESFYCIVNLHAITLPQDPKILRQKTLDLARIYLAAGVDPEKATIFIQSDVPEHAELTWVLSCQSRMGELERMTQFKDKAKVKFKGEQLTFGGEDVTFGAPSVGFGLLAYPVLMAADILLYQTDLVPIGQDQKQHLELTRDLAERFNRDFGDTFKVPEPFIPPVGAKIMSLQDPAKKMSKSDENLNGSIFLLDDADTITKKIKRAVTDSGTDINFDETRPAIKNLLTIYQLLSAKTADECVEHFAGSGYGDFKGQLAETVVEFLRPFQERIKEYDAPSLDAILKKGAEKARSIASETLQDVYEKTGIK